MKQTIDKIDLSQYLVIHFGSIRHCATVLNVSASTLYNICRSNPEDILKYTSKLVTVDSVDVRELIDVIYGEDDA